MTTDADDDKPSYAAQLEHVLERVAEWADDCCHAGHPVEIACGEDLFKVIAKARAEVGLPEEM